MMMMMMTMMMMMMMMMMMSNIFVQICQVRGTKLRCNKKKSIRRYVFSWKKVKQGQWSRLLRHVLEDSYEPVVPSRNRVTSRMNCAAGREQRMRPALLRHSSGVQSGGGKGWVSQAETGGSWGATWISWMDRILVVNMDQHMSTWVNICQHGSTYVNMGQHMSTWVNICQHMSTWVNICWFRMSKSSSQPIFQGGLPIATGTSHSFQGETPEWTNSVDSSGVVFVFFFLMFFFGFK